MSDLIRRQGVVEAIDKHIDTFDAIDANYLDGLRAAMSLLNDLPSAQPEQRWISVSETTDLPEYEVMACNKYGEFMFGFLSGSDGEYECDSENELMCDVVAWMKKPKPYRGDKNE